MAAKQIAACFMAGSYGSARRWVWPSTRNTAARASIASRCHAPTASPSRSSHTSSTDEALGAATDRKRSPPRSSTPTTLNGGSGTLGLAGSAVRRGAAAGAAVRFMRASRSPMRACSACKSPVWASAAWACSTCVRRSSSALRAASKSGWVTGLGWFFEAAACCSSSATRVLSACTCASWALAWLCSLRRDRPTLLTTARMLTSSSHAAAAMFNQRARPAFSSGSCGMVMAGPPGARGVRRRARSMRQPQEWGWRSAHAQSSGARSTPRAPRHRLTDPRPDRPAPARHRAAAVARAAGAPPAAAA
mmetsp:Transcript_26306/g.62437  ORF Transcript_26306/g.62437 Transcript_26306/m.62437 type:complete len:305 (-) Transcript_26306:905-1819(-)